MRILRYDHSLKLNAMSTAVGSTFLVVPTQKVTDNMGAAYFDAVVAEVRRLGFR
jgi:hypothetical protein